MFVQQFECGIGALFPPRKLRLTRILSGEFNLNIVSEEDVALLATHDKFEVFNYDEPTLVMVVLRMFMELGFIERFNIPLKTLYRYSYCWLLILDLYMFYLENIEMYLSIISDMHSL